MTPGTCWSHVRRKFFDVHAATQSPLAHQALQRIAALYAIEGGMRGPSPDVRRHMRHAQSTPRFDGLQAGFEQTLARISGLTESVSPNLSRTAGGVSPPRKRFTPRLIPRTLRYNCGATSNSGALPGGRSDVRINRPAAAGGTGLRTHEPRSRRHHRHPGRGAGTGRRPGRRRRSPGTRHPGRHRTPPAAGTATGHLGTNGRPARPSRLAQPGRGVAARQTLHHRPLRLAGQHDLRGAVRPGRAQPAAAGR